MEVEKYSGYISELMFHYIENETVGYIHSIFKNSLNIKFGENIVHISKIGSSLTSFGCCIREEILNFLLLNCKINDIVIKKENNLIFYTSFGIEKINLLNLKSKSLKILKKEKKNLKMIYEEIKNIDFESKIGLNKFEVEEKLKNGIKEEIQYYFTGRGKGLTPSGDDILLGFSLILYLFDENITLKYGDFTTDISRQYFKAFNKRYVNEQFFNLIYDNVKNSIEEIKKIGHTSGYDTLFGIFLGIKYKLEDGGN